jgi:hypothetical protein
MGDMSISVSSAPEIELGMYTVVDESNNMTVIFDDDSRLADYMSDYRDVPADYGAQYREMDLLSVVDNLLDELRSLISPQVVVV